MLQTIPAMLMLPFTGVIIDREDRRRLVMWLDAVRGVIIVSGCSPRVPAPREDLATLPDEHARRRRILDVLADDHRADPGTHAGGPVRGVEYFSSRGRAGRMAHRRRASSDSCTTTSASGAC